jgi:hypothetical protein
MIAAAAVLNIGEIGEVIMCLSFVLRVVLFILPSLKLIDSKPFRLGRIKNSSDDVRCLLLLE